jgi:argininosuccinate synthase
MADVNKVVLAYSGGLDTSVILKWLQDTYNCEVVTFTADIGQGEEVEPARAKAQAMGVKEIYIDDLREEFVRDFVFPMFRANTVYEGEYLLGTSIARPLIAKRLIEIANETGADAISHGATGKGNDQVRFELGAYALKPGVKVIAPWREWDLLSREKLMDYAEKHEIPIERTARRSRRTPWMPTCCTSPMKAACWKTPGPSTKKTCGAGPSRPKRRRTRPTYIELTYRKGDIVAIDGKAMSPATVLAELNKHRRRERHRSSGSGRKPLRRHEVPWLLRDARRHHHAQGPPRHRVDHPGPRSRAPERRADAQIRQPDLQRLLVEP